MHGKPVRLLAQAGLPPSLCRDLPGLAHRGHLVEVRGDGQNGHEHRGQDPDPAHRHEVVEASNEDENGRGGHQDHGDGHHVLQACTHLVGPGEPQHLPEGEDKNRGEPGKGLHHRQAVVQGVDRQREDCEEEHGLKEADVETPDAKPGHGTRRQDPGGQQKGDDQEGSGQSGQDHKHGSDQGHRKVPIHQKKAE